MCPRPCRAVDTMIGKISKEKVEARRVEEEKLKGGNDNIKAPAYLSLKQKRIFKNIVGELSNSGILTNVDVYVLCTCSIAIDRLQSIEQQINKDILLMRDKDLMGAKDKYTKDIFKCYSELSITPASRAKIGSLNANVAMDKVDPLLAILSKNKSRDA